MFDELHQLATIATKPAPGTDDLDAACQLVRRALGAEDAYVIRAGDPHFIRIGCACSPADYEIKQKGYWLIWRELAARPTIPAGLFDVRDRIASVGVALRPGSGATHLAAILPGDESNSELLIVRGPWPEGLTAEQACYVATARPILAHAVSNVLDAERRTRQREQLEALANVSAAFNEARETDNILTTVATAVAKASGFDWVTIATYNGACDAIVDRAMNVARHSDTETAARFRGTNSPQAQTELRLGVELAKTDGCILIRDVSEPGLADREEIAPMRDDVAGLQRYWERAHILSLAMFPIMFQQKALGFIAFSSSTPRGFDAPEVEFLRALVSQTATTIKGVRLYADLDASREELRQSEERFRSLVQNASDLITIIDADGTLRYASPAVERLMGYERDEWVGKHILDMLHPDDVERAADSLAAVIAAPGVHPPTTLRVRHADGSWRYIETTANNLLGVPAVRGVVHNSHDVTERWLAEAALRQSEERFRSLVQHASDMITVIEADTTVRYQSPSVTRVLGRDAAEVVGTKLSDLVHPDDVGSMLAVLSDIVSKRDGLAVAEARMLHSDGSWRSLEFIGTDQRHNPAIGGLVLNVRDVTERKSLERQLRYQALHDPLTKLANRTRFSDRLDHALIRAARTGHMVAVLFMDLDNFKGVNDSLGHAAGDVLLTTVAERVQGCLRPGDTVARLGGDEFAILLEDVAVVDDATAVTKRIFAAFDEPFELEGKELLVRASVGIAVGGQGEQAGDAEVLLRDADVAMYVAKSKGKARYEVFEASMQVSMMERLELLADLQRAVERQEFVLHFQPMMLLKTGELVGVEALVRWNHPRRGQIQPTEFIPLAEESGAILPLGAWVL
ncbi:MAG: sensor domain-containing phosphodiesterase, partial [Dehalococcoidia bacterium]